MGPIQTFKQYCCFCSQYHIEEDQEKPIKRTKEVKEFKFSDVNSEDDKKEEIEVKNE